MGRSIGPMSKTTETGSDPTAAPRLIVLMSLQPAIPRRVALQQSSPPLYQLGAILNKKAQFEKQKPWNGKCASSKLYQPRGSPHKSACATKTQRHLQFLTFDSACRLLIDSAVPMENETVPARRRSARRESHVLEAAEARR